MFKNYIHIMDLFITTYWFIYYLSKCIFLNKYNYSKIKQSWLKSSYKGEQLSNQLFGANKRFSFQVNFKFHFWFMNCLYIRQN